jgi:hypothetical protein
MTRNFLPKLTKSVMPKTSASGVNSKNRTLISFLPRTKIFSVSDMLGYGLATVLQSIGYANLAKLDPQYGLCKHPQLAETICIAMVFCFSLF